MISGSCPVQVIFQKLLSGDAAALLMSLTCFCLADFTATFLSDYFLSASLFTYVRARWRRDNPGDMHLTQTRFSAQRGHLFAAFTEQRFRMLPELSP